jgi:hypothetical protein
MFTFLLLPKVTLPLELTDIIPVVSTMAEGVPPVPSSFTSAASAFHS